MKCCTNRFPLLNACLENAMILLVDNLWLKLLRESVASAWSASSNEATPSLWSPESGLPRDRP
jgi:hypothetical protein